jgi:hypothetical protein
MKKSISFFIILLMAITSVAQNPPYGLQAFVEGNDVSLQWTEPIQGELFPLSYSSGTNFSAIGYGAENPYLVAARWEAGSLGAYDGFPLVQFEFFYYEGGSDLSLKILEGSQGDQLVYEQPLTNVEPNAWNLIYLDNPPVVDASKELWIAIEVVQGNMLMYPIGLDEGPAVAGFGDMIYYQGFWESISADYGLDYNFNLKAYVADADGNRMAIGNTSQPNLFPQNNNGNTGELAVVSTEATAAPQRSLSPDRSMPDFYNIYRDDALTGTSTDTFFEDSGLSNGIYTYGVTAVFGGEESTAAQAIAQIGSPDFSILPEIFTDSFPANASIVRQIEIANNGEIPLIWQAQTSDYSILLEVHEGSIDPGASQTLNLYIYTYDFPLGANIESITFSTNDVTFPTFVYNLNFNIIATPAFYIESDQINFGPTFIDQPALRQIYVFNDGLETLILSDFTSDSPFFESPVDELAIAPYEFAFLPVIFSPEEVTTYNGVLTFTTNDPETPTYDIQLSGSGIVPAPSFLFAQGINNEDVELNWEDATGENGSSLAYCSDVYYSSFALGQGLTYSIAIGWPSDFLENYESQSVEYVSFFPSDEVSEFTLKAWAGENRETLIYSQQIPDYTPYQWNTIQLDAPIFIDATENLYIGLEINQVGFNYPAAIDEGPSVEGFSDLIYFENEWLTLADFGFSNNWLIKAFVSEVNNPVVMQQLPRVAIEKQNTGTNNSLQIQQYTHTGIAHLNRQSRSLLFEGYNLFRDGELIESLLQENTYYDAGLDLGTYTYQVTAVYEQGESQPISRMVQLGTPVLSINPSSINDSIESGNQKTYTIEFSNSGIIDLEWAFQTLPNGISSSALSGVLAPGASEELTLTFDATQMFPGLRNMELVILTNNLSNPTSLFQINMLVTGDQGLVFSEDEIDFGMVNLNEQIVRTLEITNNSDIFGYVYVESDSYYFQPHISYAHIAPGDNSSIVISFSGNEIGAYNGNLLVIAYYNDDIVEYNIPMSAFVNLPVPSGLEAALVGDTVNLSWLPPGINPNMLQYGNGGIQVAIGYGVPGVFEAAAKFGPETLQYYTGKVLSHIGFFLWETGPDFSLKVYSGENAENLIYEQVIGNELAVGWNDIALDQALAITADDYLWIGYELTQQDIYYASGVDFGPAEPGKGDLVRIEGGEWTFLTDYGLPYNWNLRGWVSEGDSSMLLSQAVPSPVTFSQNVPVTTPFEPAAFAFENSQRSATNSLIGYNIYRNGSMLANAIVETNYTDILEAPGGYLYEVTSVFPEGESMPAAVFITNDTTMVVPDGWNFNPTAFAHNIYIPVETMSRSNLEMSAGDMIGVFYHQDGVPYCAGVVGYQNGYLMITAYGDDPTTTQKEGLAFGETIYWKVYFQELGMEYELNVTYDAAMPQHDGTFHMNGLSMLSTMEAIITSVDQVNSSADWLVYPNPNNGQFTINGLESNDRVKVMDAAGRIIIHQEVNSTPALNMSIANKGLYIIELERNNRLEHRKLIIQ